MNFLDALIAAFKFGYIAIRAWRDPAWSQKIQGYRDAHVENIAEFAKASRQWTSDIQSFEQSADGSENRSSLRQIVDADSDHLHELLMRELAADGSYVGEHPGVAEPCLEIPISVLDAIYASLSGRRRDAQIGQHLTDINQSSTS